MSVWGGLGLQAMTSLYIRLLNVSRVPHNADGGKAHQNDVQCAVSCVCLSACVRAGRAQCMLCVWALCCVVLALLQGFLWLLQPFPFCVTPV